jgi:hypothetical protein
MFNMAIISSQGVNEVNDRPCNLQLLQPVKNMYQALLNLWNI